AIIDLAIKLRDAIPSMRNALGHSIRRAPWPQNLSQALEESITDVKNSLNSLENILKEAAVRGKGLENCWQRTVKLIDRFHTHTQSNLKELIHWFETHVKNFTLQLTPMVIANQFQQYIKNHKRSWIFTSATLTVQNSFKLFIDSLGLHQALQLALDSPFDYQKQAILYAP